MYYIRSSNLQNIKQFFLALKFKDQRFALHKKYFIFLRPYFITDSALKKLKIILKLNKTEINIYALG